MVMMCMASPAAAAEPYLFDIIKKPAYARALTSLFDSSGKLPGWTREMRKPVGNYVASPGTRAAAGGTTYEMFHACKPHDCQDNQMVVMFAPNGAQAWGALQEAGKPTSYLGSPNDAQQTALKGEFSPP